MTKTKIDWADRVWNPVTGCSKVSQGCKNCYAERMAKRFWGERKFTDVQSHNERLMMPLHWRKPSKVFVNSVSDLFHPDVSNVFIGKVFTIMALANRHTFIILTKRPDRMQKLLSHLYGEFWQTIRINLLCKDYVFPDIEKSIIPLKNVWLGVSVENQEAADFRIPILLQTPAVVRLVSVEPMLEPVDIYPLDNTLTSVFDNPNYGNSKLDWVICGCESGPGARPMDIEWARELKHDCVDQQIPFFFKQAMIDGKLVHMPELDGEQYAEYPEASE